MFRALKRTTVPSQPYYAFIRYEASRLSHGLASRKGTSSLHPPAPAPEGFRIWLLTRELEFQPRAAWPCLHACIVCMHVYALYNTLITHFTGHFWILGKGGCSGWEVQRMAGMWSNRQDTHTILLTLISQILEIQIQIASDYTWFPLHPLCGM